MMTAMTPKQVEDSLMQMSRNYAALSNTYGSMDRLMERAADLASIKSQSSVTPQVVALVMASFAEAKAAMRPEIVENYEETILWTMIIHGLFNEREDRGIPRVEKNLMDALKQVDKDMKEGSK